MKIVLPSWIKSLIGSLCGSSTRDQIVTFLESDLKAAFDVLKAIPDALKTGNLALAEASVSAFLAHLPQPVRDIIVSTVQKNFPLTELRSVIGAVNAQ